MKASAKCVSVIKDTIVEDWKRFRPPELADHTIPPVVMFSLEQRETEVLGEEFLKEHPYTVLRIVGYTDPGDEGVTLSVYRDGDFQFYDLCRVMVTTQGSMDLLWRGHVVSGTD
jgi:hypothetical protein